MATKASGFRGIVAVMTATFVFSGCKQDPSAWPPKSGSGEAGRGAPATGNAPGFTPAEIRRDHPVDIDTAGLATAPNEAKPAAAVAVAPAPAPATRIDSTPSKPPKAAVVQPAPVPKAVVAAVAPPATGSEPDPGLIQPGESGDWVLQVNVHRSEAEARAQVSKLGQMGIAAYAIQVPTGDANLTGNYWRVRVGRFTTRPAAQNYGKAILEPKGLKFWIDRKSNETRQAGSP